MGAPPANGSLIPALEGIFPGAPAGSSPARSQLPYSRFRRRSAAAVESHRRVGGPTPKAALPMAAAAAAAAVAAAAAAASAAAAAAALSTWGGGGGCLGHLIWEWAKKKEIKSLFTYMEITNNEL